MSTTNEQRRLEDHQAKKMDWQKWGPYLSERAWGTVREDYSPYGTAWDYFPHDHARSRAYRWNEDGLAGISDRSQHLCLALALWNGQDPILKERIFGLTGPQGNHGEDAKEYWFYLDNTPTHSYMKMLYKYPQAAFPYADLVSENALRGYYELEYELLDTGVFDEDRYFDVVVEYAKASPEDILIQVTAINRGPEPAQLHLLPTLWCRNTWRWGYEAGPMGDTPDKPSLTETAPGVVRVEHPATGQYWLFAKDADALLFTENETNQERLFNSPNPAPYVKDAFHRFLVNGETGVVNPAKVGTKTGAHYYRTLEPGESWTVQLRLRQDSPSENPFENFKQVLKNRRSEADVFYAAIQPTTLDADERSVQRQALAGMLWTKQLYYYDIKQWLQGDPGTPKPSASRRKGRNSGWEHLNNFDILSMPDKWEYPWYAAWDLAFHCLPLALVDTGFAKRQLDLMTRAWYMHPNGQLPAYEWAFGDVNPPVHAWAAWRVYQLQSEQSGDPDRAFLEGIFHKLLLNFTWWVNKKDEDGRNVFQGGFLGLDNISLFDRSAALPTAGHIDQSDGTAWMGFYTLGMLRIALELAKVNPIYQNLATKFYEHFLGIASAMSAGFDGRGLWDEEDGFYYDVLHLPDDSLKPLKVRSLVGLMPLLAVETLEPELLLEMGEFDRRMHWFIQNRPELAGKMASVDEEGVGKRHLISIVTAEMLRSILRYMLDESEFLSDFGIRSVSKIHEKSYTIACAGETFSINYQPAESTSGLFGGNSNWRGPIWFPINFLLIESLKKYHLYYGDEFKVECPTGSGNLLTLDAVASELSSRLKRIFLQNDQGERPVYGGARVFQENPHWRDLVLFFEYFHGDNGAGLGASHQTGWTGLVASLMQNSG